MKRKCEHCGGKLRAHYYREVRCDSCSDATDYDPIRRRPSPPPVSDEVYLKVAHEKADALAALKRANQLLRSAYSIAIRRGVGTNWDAFTDRLAAELNNEHVRKLRGAAQ